MQIANKVHFHDDSERDYFAVLGKYISAWGQFENGLYGLIRMLGFEYRRVLDISGAGKLPPAFKPGIMSFERKVDFLEKSMRRCPELWAPQERVHDLLRWARDEVDARHHLIHGVDQVFLRRSPYETYMFRSELRTAPAGAERNGIAFDVNSIAMRYEIIGSSCANLMILFSELGDLIDVRLRGLATLEDVAHDSSSTNAKV